MDQQRLALASWMRPTSELMLPWSRHASLAGGQASAACRHPKLLQLRLHVYDGNGFQALTHEQMARTQSAGLTIATPHLTVWATAQTGAWCTHTGYSMHIFTA
eukprot:364201-Chlamydomonas_euryale.AAC.15